MKSQSVTRFVLLLVLGCSRRDALSDAQAKLALQSYVQGHFCEDARVGAGCGAKLVSMTPLTENSPTGREASANVAYNAPEACSIDVTATFAKAAAGGWVLKSVDGVTLCGPRESIGRWGSPASFAQAVK